MFIYTTLLLSNLLLTGVTPSLSAVSSPDRETITAIYPRQNNSRRERSSRRGSGRRQMLGFSLDFPSFP